MPGGYMSGTLATGSSTGPACRPDDRASGSARPSTAGITCRPAECWSRRSRGVGCGTGRLAVVLAQRVGPTGTVNGIDPAKEMVTRATASARRARVPVTFQQAFAQQLPFSDASFDASRAPSSYTMSPTTTAQQP
jgi:SAM-dependent methyltransferase